MPPKLGQHFLVRDSVLETIAKAACGDYTARVVEIGPGKGALTRHLLGRTDELHVVELDRSLADLLRRKMGYEEKLRIHQADVLEIDLMQWGTAVITGNLPYYITSPIIEKFLNLNQEFDRAVFLMQWEVLQRMVAAPGSRAFGYLTVATQLICDLEVVAKVPPSAFHPPPKVDSGALLLKRKQVQIEDAAEVRRFAGWCFEHKRKTLRNNLRPYFGEAISELPESSMRAEQLGVADLIGLYRRLSKIDITGSS